MGSRLGLSTFPRNRLVVAALILVFLTGITVRLLTLKPVWQIEIEAILTKSIPIGTPRKKVEAWLYAKQFSYKSDEESDSSAIATFIPVDNLSNKPIALYDSIRVSLIFDTRGKLQSYRNIRAIRIGMP